MPRALRRNAPTLNTIANALSVSFHPERAIGCELSRNWDDGMVCTVSDPYTPDESSPRGPISSNSVGTARNSDMFTSTSSRPMRPGDSRRFGSVADGAPSNPPLQRSNGPVASLPFPFAAERQYRWTDMEPDIANVALGFAMEFGKNWLQPIHARLAAKFPTLTAPELDEYDRCCRDVMDFGNAQVPPLWRQASGREGEAFTFFESRLLERYAWLSRRNLKRLFSQGCYYAHHEGELS